MVIHLFTLYIELSDFLIDIYLTSHIFFSDKEKYLTIINIKWDIIKEYNIKGIKYIKS